MLVLGKDLKCQIKILSPWLQTLFSLFLLLLQQQHMGSVGVNGGHGQFVLHNQFAGGTSAHGTETGLLRTNSG